MVFVLPEHLRLPFGEPISDCGEFVLDVEHPFAALEAAEQALKATKGKRTGKKKNKGNVKGGQQQKKKKKGTTAEEEELSEGLEDPDAVYFDRHITKVRIMVQAS